MARSSETSQGGADPAASTYARRIEVAPGPTAVDAEMEDHHHHFKVHLDVAAGIITGVTTTAVRSPWNTCSSGAAAASSLEGLSLIEASDPRRWASDRSLHCTHVADLALLAVRHARDDVPLGYDVRVVPAAGKERTATLGRGGARVMEWHLDGGTIVGLPPFDRLPLAREVFLPWIRAHLSAAEIEYAMVLRRAASLAFGNAFDLDAYATAGDVHPPDDTCFTYRQDVALTARRNVGVSRPLSWSDREAP